VVQLVPFSQPLVYLCCIVQGTLATGDGFASLVPDTRAHWATRALHERCQKFHFKSK